MNSSRPEARLPRALSLYRLSISRYRDSVSLKGALLCFARAEPDARPFTPRDVRRGRKYYSNSAMSWGTVELEPEVDGWLSRLGAEDFGQAQFYVDLLEREGVALGAPYTRQLRGKLRELRFYIGRERYRISYYVATGGGSSC